MKTRELLTLQKATGLYDKDKSITPRFIRKHGLSLTEFWIIIECIFEYNKLAISKTFVKKVAETFSFFKFDVKEDEDGINYIIC